MALICLMPFGAWLVGSGIVWATPASYQSSAMLKLDTSPEGLQREVARLKSDAVVGPAAQALAPGPSSNPMSAYILWSSLSVKEQPGTNLIKVEARGKAPEEARRIVMAVLQSYEQNRAEATSIPKPAGRLVYIDPLAMPPSQVANETRIMLGVAGIALLGLLLCIPLLDRLEMALPMERLA